jgi:3-methylfumaryl-CoA hydratase
MTHQVEEILRPGPSAALGALLEVDLPGDVLLPLWHWVHLLEMAPQHLLGPDGHPTIGVPEPPGPDRKRMFAGGRVTPHEPLRYGVPAARTVVVADRAVKQGSSGTLEFVTVRQELVQDGKVCTVEEQDIVYRDAHSSLPPAAAAEAADPDRPPATWALPVDERFLFRFSALTYNAHRIHYDRAWAAFEGYDGLVVHGPLQALLMAEAARAAGVDLVGRTFGFRLQRALIGVQEVSVGVETTAGQGWVRGEDGVTSARSRWSS